DGFNDSGEPGPDLLLPDGRVLAINSSGLIAYYTPPDTLDGPGSWQLGPYLGFRESDDGFATVLPNGHVFFVNYRGLSGYFDFDPIANSLIPVPTIVQAYGAPVVLPTGQMLFGYSLYTPSSLPDPSWKPVISSVTDNGDGTFHVTGARLNGMTTGATADDD